MDGQKEHFGTSRGECGTFLSLRDYTNKYTEKNENGFREYVIL